MALAPGSSSFNLWSSSLFDTVSRWTHHLFSPRDFSPEDTLANSPHIDPHFIPRVPMSAENIDVHLLNQLGAMGLKRGKLVTAQTHPEIMAAWQQMSARAGLKKAPQLIIAESEMVNAATFSNPLNPAATPEEAVVTTGLLKTYTKRELLAALGHELAHGISNHTVPRLGATAIFAGGGMLLGNRFAHRGGLGPVLQKAIKGDGWLKKLAGSVFGYEARPVTLLGSLLYIATGGYFGQILANQLTVRPTELEADYKGAIISGDPQALISALQKLETQRPKNSLSATWNFFRSGYPSTKDRIRHLEKLAAKMPYMPPVLQPEAVSVTAVSPAQPRPVISDVQSGSRVELPQTQLLH